jgi:hypothetical protein
MKKLILTALAVCGFAISASAQVTFYTDRNAYETALGSFSVFDFNSSSGSFDGTSLDVGPFTLTGDSTGQFSDMEVTGGQARANTCGVAVCGFDFGYSLSFDAATFGFGADYSNVSGGQGIDFLVFTLGGLSFEGPTANNGFFGFITDASFTDFTVSGGDEIHEFDNVTFGGVSAVPEPATWLMMIFGFGLVGLQMRRRSRIVSDLA